MADYYGDAGRRLVMRCLDTCCQRVRQVRWSSSARCELEVLRTRHVRCALAAARAARLRTRRLQWRRALHPVFVRRLLLVAAKVRRVQGLALLGVWLRRWRQAAAWRWSDADGRLWRYRWERSRMGVEEEVCCREAALLNRRLERSEITSAFAAGVGRLLAASGYQRSLGLPPAPVRPHVPRDYEYG